MRKIRNLTIGALVGLNALISNSYSQTPQSQPTSVRYDDFKIDVKVDYRSPQRYGAIEFNFDGKGAPEAIALLSLQEVEQIDNYPITKDLVEDLARRGAATFFLYTSEESKEKIEDSNSLRSKIHTRLPSYFMFQEGKKTDLAKLVESEDLEGLLKLTPNLSGYTFNPPSITRLGGNPNRIKRTVSDSERRDKIKTNCTFIYDKANNPKYALLEMQLSNVESERIIGLLDLRIKDLQRTDINGKAISYMSFIGTVDFRGVYIMPDAVEKIKVNKDLEAQVSLVFPKDKWIIVQKDSIEEKAFTSGNPEDLLNKRKAFPEYISIPAEIKKKN